MLNIAAIRPTYAELERRVQELEQSDPERKDMEAALRESEERFRTLLDALYGGIGMHDEDVIWDCNQGLADITGYSVEELIGMNVLELIAPDWREFVMQKIQSGFEQCYDVNGRRKNGTEYHLRIQGKNIPYKGITARVAEFRDITETKALQNRLVQAQKMEAIGTLAGGIAHDFNNILGAIMGYAQLAQLHSSENPKVQEYINQLCMASQRAKELVQQILAFSRQSKSEKAPVDVGLIVKEVLKLLRASIPSTIEIRQNVKSGIGVVNADQTQIHQIIMNLCTNAFHAMEKDGGTLDVDLRPVIISEDDVSVYPDLQPGQYLKLIVADNGHGMDADTMTRIFEPYFTTKDKGQGTGMGLATVHGIVKDHEGDSKVYSEPGVGTSFHVLLPMIESIPGAIVETLQTLPTGNEQILFVDDEKYLVDIGRELLESLGYRVETRTSSYDALEAFRMHHDKYHMVITDMTMPKMTGEKLAAAIKKISPQIPVILCTGYSRRIAPENALKMGINSILMKPLTLHELANTVRRVMDNCRTP